MLEKVSRQASRPLPLNFAESEIISLVAYLATLIQIEIGLNGVPKPISSSSHSVVRERKKSGHFRSFSFGKEQERCELIANHIYVLANKMAQPKIRVVAASAFCFLNSHRQNCAKNSNNSACVFLIYERNNFLEFFLFGTK
mgnify:CR=1 FL=1